MLKRLFDFTLSLILIALFSPVMLIVAMIVKINMGSPVLFRQTRPGLNGRPFNLYKFRTMSNQKDAAGNLLPDDMRLNTWGSNLRKLSLDELPQLFNVLKGELSFVGPRPLLMEYLPRYSKEQARRHDLKPGITGWAQVNGRNDLSWEEKFALDVWYVDNRSVWLDMKILGLTLLKVIKAEGVNQVGSATMPKFMGSDDEG